jgi:hypothetical protein
MKSMKKKLTLTEACMMDASGELGAAAKARLLEHVQQFPKALLEYEIARGNMALLNALPKPEMSDEEKKKMANAIKAGIQKKILDKKREEQAKRRMKLIYRAVAGISAVAAGLVIAMSINYLVGQDQKQRMAVARAEQVLNTYFAEDTKSSFEGALDQARKDLDELQNNTIAVHQPFAPSAFEGALNEIEITPEDRMDFGPPS